jgi:hypothetical protein
MNLLARHPLARHGGLIFLGQILLVLLVPLVDRGPCGRRARTGRRPPGHPGGKVTNGPRRGAVGQGHERPLADRRVGTCASGSIMYGSTMHWKGSQLGG